VFNVPEIPVKIFRIVDDVLARMRAFNVPEILVEMVLINVTRRRRAGVNVGSSTYLIYL
jgi:hypothetical protein